MNVVSAHLNHDSTLSLDLQGRMINIELERVFGKRHYDARYERALVGDLAGLIKSHCDHFDLGIHVGGADEFAQSLFQELGIDAVLNVDHHVAHAAAAFYQSPFDESIVLSYDGGGNDGTFRTFLASRKSGIHPLDDGLRLNLGIPYRSFAHPIREVRKPDDGKERSNAGKLMGLAAFGRFRPDWAHAIEHFFLDCSTVEMSTGMYRTIVGKLRDLGPGLGLNLTRDALIGSDAHDLAATAQRVFEDIVIRAISPIVDRMQLPLCLSGGCALNVVVNQRLADTLRVPMFVPPNPNDSGLAQGALLWHARPLEPIDVTYSGIGIVDTHLLSELVAQYRPVEATPSAVAQRLGDGRVVAVMRGQSEHGPRALGNRSILCDPSVPHMQDRLNTRIKFRESFRPYAPVIRAEDAARFFENAKNDMSYMSFNPTVKPAWRAQLSAAMNVDFTARAQTLRREANPWLYDVISAFEALRGFGALVNTSFNSKGQPMVTSLAAAIDLWRSTDLDCLVVDSLLFCKSQI